MAIVAISRGTFTGGQALAQCVAERLGSPCVAREEIIEAATWYGISARKLSETADKPPWFWEQLTAERAAYVDCVRAALCDRAIDGNLVFHGHVGHLLLPDISHVLRVRVIADAKSRVKVAMEQRGLTPDEARAYMDRVDRERVEWTRFLYGVEWDDPSLYDLVLNISRVSIACGCEIVARVAAEEEFRPTASSLKAMADLALRSRVSATLARDPRVMATGLNVAADGGLVTISGSVRWRQAADLIPSVVQHMDGVRDVRCSLVTAPETE